jgi:hypothetical protein
MATETATATHALSIRARSLGLGLIVVAIALVSLFGRAGDANAGFAWCASDPIVRVNGQDIQVWVNVPVDKLDLVNVVYVEFHVPSNADARIVLVDQTFFPEKAVIKKDLPVWNGRDDLVVEVKIQVDTRGDRGPGFRIGAEVIDAEGTTWYDGSSDQGLVFTAVAISRDGRNHDRSSYTSR